MRLAIARTAILLSVPVWLVIGALMVWLFNGDLYALAIMGALLALFAILGWLGLRYAPPREEMTEEEWAHWNAW